MGVLQPGGELDLSLEALGAQRLGQVGVEHLERDRPLVAEVLGQVHDGHAAAAELPLERVASAQPSLQLRAQIGHCRGVRGSG